ncbi:MAG: phosphatidate cytidylyltransferase [Mangrovibacterium sp.]
MIKTIYIIILIYFILGGLGFYIINRKKDPKIARESYIKFFTYFVIINILFFSITIHPAVFSYLALLIIAMGTVELSRLFRRSGFRLTLFFLLSVLLYAMLAGGFFLFSRLNRELVLFSFLVLSIFDSFSQITGQLWGKTKLFPLISPNKTLGGLVGGSLTALFSAWLLSSLYGGTVFRSLLLSSGIIVFAFAGDLAASWYKRKYRVKDFSKLIPGHGGFLDRFDSLIAGGAWVAFNELVLQYNF